MSTLPPHDSPAVYWIDAELAQQGPESLATVIERLAYGQIPDSTPVWWQGATTWTAFSANPELVALLQVRMQPAIPTPEPEFAAPVFTAPAAEQSPGESMFAGASPFSAAVHEVAAPSAFAPAGHENPLVPTAASTPGLATGGSGGMFDSAPTNGAAEMPSIVMPETGAQAGQPLFGATALRPEPAPEPAPDVVPALNLGDANLLAEAFDAMQGRFHAYSTERGRAARLDETVVAALQQAATNLGFTIDTHALTEEHHSFTLAAPDGSTASLSVSRVPAAATLSAAVEQPLSITVHHGGSASTGLFVGDYLRTDDSVDVDGLTHSLAAVVSAAARAT